MIYITHFQAYKYGCFRRFGSYMECFASQPTLPTGYRPAENAIVTKTLNPVTKKEEFRIWVRILGWNAK